MEQITGISITTLRRFITWSVVAGLCCTGFPVFGGSCANPVVPIKQGQIATCDGFLFSDEAEKAASEARDNVSFYKSLNDKLEQKNKLEEDNNKVLTDRLKLYMDASDTLSKTVAQKDNTESIYRLGYFALGVLITGVIAVNVGR